MVIVPCHNEELTVGKVVADFRAALPDAQILVVDNASRDRTAEVAREAGAEVIREPRPGKGFALLSGFRHARAGGAELPRHGGRRRHLPGRRTRPSSSPPPRPAPRW